MYNKRSTLFLTELLLLLLISQLYRPIQQFIHMPIALTISKSLLFLASWISLLVIPGWWRSYLFFDDFHIGGFERFIVSLAISLALLVFSSAYLQVGGVALYPRTVLVVLSLWTFFGILVAFARSKNISSLEEEIG